MIRFRVQCWAVLAAAVWLTSAANAQVKGPSSSATPYLLPTSRFYDTTSLLTVTDTVARRVGVAPTPWSVSPTAWELSTTMLGPLGEGDDWQGG